MIEDIAPNLYRVQIPLPGNPLKALNAYVVRSPKRNLIIDTGFNREECRQAMLSSLGTLGVDLAESDFFITHLHADHYGQVSALASPGSKVYFNRHEASWFESGTTQWDDSFDFASHHGFPDEELQAALQNHPGYKYRSNWHHLELTILKEGDRIDLGDYALEVIETPGHSKGHLCLYEPRQKMLFSGDHLLIDITPNLQLWSEQGDPLRDYLASLEKIRAYDVRLVLPGHRRIFTHCGRRIEELQRHHEKRCDEILSILRAGKMTAYEVASQMTWDIQYETWDCFPVSQKWFATGEAVAHLKYLEVEKLIERHASGAKIRFGLS